MFFLIASIFIFFADCGSSRFSNVGWRGFASYSDADGWHGREYPGKCGGECSGTKPPPPVSGGGKISP
jgi:hypothetical protein